MDRRLIAPKTPPRIDVRSLAILLSIASYACSTPHTVLKPESDVVVATPGEKETRLVRAGAEIEVGDRPFVIEKPGHHSIYIVPITKEESSTIDIRLRPTTQWTDAQVAREIDGRLSALLADVTAVYQLLGKGEKGKALAAAEQIASREPDVVYVQFLLSSCFAVNGRTEEAIKAVSRALSRHPNDERGRGLYRRLVGRDFLPVDEMNDSSPSTPNNEATKASVTEDTP